MNKKVLGILITVFLIGLVIVQLQQVRAQLADEPITGPITSPIESPTDTVVPSETITVTPTESPTPTLITTVSSTPTPTESPTPTPTLAPGTRLGGLDLDSYCTNTNNPGLLLSNGTWSCANGSVSIDMNAACQWQYGMSDVVANQDIANNPWSWTCYVPPVPVSTTPTVTPTETPTVTPTEMPSETPTPTQSEPTETVTPSQPETVSPTLTPTCTPTPMQTEETVKTHHSNKSFFPMFHFSAGFPFVLNSSFFGSNHFFVQSANVEVIHAKICTNHDKE